MAVWQEFDLDNAALRRLGYGRDAMTGHGFCSMTYNYADYLPERRKMMQAWADCLDGLRRGLT